MGRSIVTTVCVLAKLLGASLPMQMQFDDGFKIFCAVNDKNLKILPSGNRERGRRVPFDLGLDILSLLEII